MKPSSLPPDERILEVLARWEELRQRGQDIPVAMLCRDCPELIAGVQRAIEDLLSWQPLLDVPQADAVGEEGIPNLPQASDLPKHIARYRVERILGQGGFGIVYLAYDELLSRRVAIKVPHAHLVTQAADAAAYLREARTVANLDHPNIVPVHDVGSTDRFPCFIVSKFIDGSTLKAKAQTSRLSLEKCAAFVATVADALHFAHKQGLVHRDIKPGNLLLDQSGKPFVADFGLALRERDLGKGPRYAGTPAYMSPEQARGEGHRVDGRSDIFSLGVVPYELLTGRRPFHADSREELLEQITSLDVRPPRQWDDTIPKELERICLRALAKRASERYTTAKDMAEDLRNFLAQPTPSQPVVGAAPSAGSLSAAAGGPPASRAGASRPAGASSPTATPPSSDSPPITIVPKGLRSFDVHDADFFLELLPGPRDRDGLPESLRFWKTRIEEQDADNRFAVGLIYGPSGCGKSSWVKAGLLPRLGEAVIAVYVEATALETETRLLNGLRKGCPALPTNLGLKETVAALRRGPSIALGKKVLMVLDQFEQWLHAKKEEEHTELVQALRQCDGERVQCVVLVRDDFWMAVTRFMQELEICLVEGQNSGAVDLFSLRHAEKVLAAFGRAFGVLPEKASATSKEQQEFLTRAVSGLAQENKVICVRLALFADMMKGRPWTPASLKEVGGTEGVGVTFLEETFSAAMATPEHRYHQKAARAVLKALLPESGSDIKGSMRSYAELLEASSSAHRPGDFDELVRILDRELRLITPTDPEGKEETAQVMARSPQVMARSPDRAIGATAQVMARSPDRAIGADRRSPGAPEETCGRGAWHGQETVPQQGETVPQQGETVPQQRQETVPQQRGVVQAGEKYYQLTHDYLVPSLREWLTRKQKETRRGRAELLLTDRASVWIARPENRQLPSLWQWVQIRWLTRSKSWTAPQRQMMRKANRYHAVRGLLVAVLVALLSWGSSEGYNWTQAEKLVEAIVSADTTDVPRLVERLTPYRRWANPRLVRYTEDAPESSKEHLHASLALVPVDGGQGEYLYRRLLEAGPMELAVIRDALRGQANVLSERLWGVLGDSQDEPVRRFRTACALAGFDVAIDQPHQSRWQQASQFVVGQLLVAVQHNPSHYLPLLEMLRPVRKTLLGPLAEVFRQRQRPDSERSFATLILADYAALEPQLLADLLLDADEKQFAVIYPKFKEQGERGLPVLMGAIDRKLPPDAKDEAKENLAKRQANAAVALLGMDQAGKVWPLLKQRSDPRVRSYLIQRFGPLGADAQALVTRLADEPDVTIRRALILSLGPEEFGAGAWTPEAKQRLVDQLQELYRTAADPGLHAATEWLLRQWQHGDWLRQTNAACAQDQEQREQRLDGIQRELRKQKDQTPPQWYVNSQGQTMVIIPGPVEFVMGSPSTEEGRDSDELQHKKRIGRTFAIAAKAVTVEQYRKFRPGYGMGEIEQKARTADSPVISTDWFQAAAYCNWLSQQEGLPESECCYEPLRDPKALPALAASSVGLLAGSFGPLAATGGLFPGRTDPEYKGGMKLARNYLQRRGYRLPTEAEWEYACRAGAVTSRYYGETEELLDKYAWYIKNAQDRTWPVGSKKPNDLGLFDMHGNVWTWCQEKYQNYPQPQGEKAIEDKEGILSIKVQDGGLLRGGSFHAQAVNERSAFRHRGLPTDRLHDVGLRPARTFTP